MARSRATTSTCGTRPRSSTRGASSSPIPNEELPAGRPLKMTPSYDAQKAAGARFGVVWGMETPQYFAPHSRTSSRQPSLRRSNAHPIVAAEVAATRAAAGLLDTGVYGRYEVSGPRSRRMARSAARQPAAARRQAPARADAVALRQAHGRSDRHASRTGPLLAGGLLLPAGVAPAMVPRSSARFRRRDREPLGELARLLALGSALARHPRPAHPRGCGRCGIALSRLSAARHRTHAGRGRAPVAHRRTRL